LVLYLLFYAAGEFGYENKLGYVDGPEEAAGGVEPG